MKSADYRRVLMQVPFPLSLSTVGWFPWSPPHSPCEIQSQTVHDDDVRVVGARSTCCRREGSQDRHVGRLVTFYRRRDKRDLQADRHRSAVCRVQTFISRARANDSYGTVYSCLDSFLINGRGQRICPEIDLLTSFASPVAGPLTDKACPLPNSTLSMGPAKNYTAQYPDQVPERLYQGCSNTSNVSRFERMYGRLWC